MDILIASAFVLGLFIGCLIGVLVMALTFMVKDVAEQDFADARQFEDSEPVFPQTRQM